MSGKNSFLLKLVFFELMLEAFYVCVQCRDLPDNLKMLTECFASVFTVVLLHYWNSLSMYLAGRGETGSKGCLLLLSSFFFKKKKSFFFCRYWIFMYLFWHVARCKYRQEKQFCLFLTDFWSSLKILILMETNGGGVGYEIWFCHRCFLRVGICLPTQLKFGHRWCTTELQGRAFVISTCVVYLLSCLSCRWLHHFLICINRTLIAVAFFVCTLSFGYQ